MGKGHHWELCLWRLYLVPGPFLSLCFLAAIMDAELFYPDLPGLRSLSLWPKPQLWNQAAERRLEETKNNSLCKTQKGLWLPKREVGIQQKQDFAFLDTLAEGEKSNRSPQWKWVFPGDCFPRDPGGGGSQRHLALTALLYHRQLSLCCCQTDWDILQTLYSPYTHLWFEYGKKNPGAHVERLVPSCCAILGGRGDVRRQGLAGGRTASLEAILWRLEVFPSLFPLSTSWLLWWLLIYFTQPHGSEVSKTIS